MQITPPDIAEFQALWKEVMEKDITDSKAEQYGQNIIGFVQIVSESSSQHAPSNPSQS